ncbi:MAG: SH3 domain-containing protein [Thiohalomonadales bacterium]
MPQTLGCKLYHLGHTAVCVCLAVFYFFSTQVGAAEYAIVEVVDPYIELHTGPGRGYPIFHVVIRHESVEVLKRKTDWFKVRTVKGKVGWVSLDQMDNTFTAPEVKAQFGHLTYKNFEDRVGEFGVMLGNFEGATLMTVYGGLSLSQNIAVEISLSQASGEFTQSFMAEIGIESRPFPAWKVSPFFTMGLGYLKNQPRSNLGAANERSDNLVYAGLGLRYYVTRRLVLIGVVKQNIIFLDRSDSGEFFEWKGGISIFY